MSSEAGSAFFRCLRCPDGQPADDRFHPVPDTRDVVCLEPGERVLWRGRTNLAEHIYTDAMDDYEVCWTLPTRAHILVTDRRVAYACRDWNVADGWTGTDAPPHAPGSHPARAMLAHAVHRAKAAVHRPRMVAVGQVRYQRPHRLYVLPARDGVAAPNGRLFARASRLLLVCAGYQTAGRPTLMLSGGDIADVVAADEMANIVCSAIIRFRIAHAETLGLFPADLAALRAQTSAPGFANRTGGRSQCISLRGGLFLGFLRGEEYERSDAAVLTRPVPA